MLNINCYHSLICPHFGQTAALHAPLFPDAAVMEEVRNIVHDLIREGRVVKALPCIPVHDSHKVGVIQISIQDGLLVTLTNDQLCPVRRRVFAGGKCVHVIEPMPDTVTHIFVEAVIAKIAVQQRSVRRFHVYAQQEGAVGIPAELIKGIGRPLEEVGVANLSIYGVDDLVAGLTVHQIQ